MAVQKPLRGLISYLGLFRGGQLRMEVDPVVRPTIDMDKWLAPAEWWMVEDAAVAANSFLDGPTVPANRIWRLKWISGLVSSPGAVETNFTVNLIRNTGGVQFSMPLQPPVNVGSFANPFYQVLGVQSMGYGFSADGLEMNPGDFLRLKLRATTGPGNNLCRMFAQYQQIEV